MRPEVPSSSMIHFLLLHSEVLLEFQQVQAFTPVTYSFLIPL